MAKRRPRKRGEASTGNDAALAAWRAESAASDAAIEAFNARRQPAHRPELPGWKAWAEQILRESHERGPQATRAAALLECCARLAAGTGDAAYQAETLARAADLARQLELAPDADYGASTRKRMQDTARKRSVEQHADRVAEDRKQGRYAFLTDLVAAQPNLTGGALYYQAAKRRPLSEGADRGRASWRRIVGRWEREGRPKR